MARRPPNLTMEVHIRSREQVVEDCAFMTRLSGLVGFGLQAAHQQGL